MAQNQQARRYAKELREEIEKARSNAAKGAADQKIDELNQQHSSELVGLKERHNNAIDSLNGLILTERSTVIEICKAGLEKTATVFRSHLESFRENINTLPEQAKDYVQSNRTCKKMCEEGVVAGENDGFNPILSLIGNKNHDNGISLCEEICDHLSDNLAHYDGVEKLISAGSDLAGLCDSYNGTTTN